MKGIVNTILVSARAIIEKYLIIIAALVIYLYYLLTSVNLFQHTNEKRSFIDYVIQFAPLIFLWLAFQAYSQLQKIRKEYQLEQEQRHQVERVIDRQQIYGQLVNDITTLLQDNVNNPLAVISVTTQEIRRKFETDVEIMRWLDRIDGAMNRIHHTIRDLQAYEAEKLLNASTEVLKQQRAQREIDNPKGHQEKPG